MVELKIVVHKPLKVKKPLLFEGFSGVGLVGTLAAQYLIEKLGAEQVGHIESDDLPPIAVLVKGEIKFPIRLYESVKHNLVFFESEFPIPPKAVIDIAEAIAVWAKKNNVRKVVCLEGVGMPHPPQSANVYGITNSRKGDKELEKYVRLLQNGIIIGVSAALMLECKARNIPAVCLMAESHTDFPDGLAAASLLGKLNEMFGFNVDVKPLEKEAKAFETKLKGLVQKAKTVKKATQQNKMIYG